MVTWKETWAESSVAVVEKDWRLINENPDLKEELDWWSLAGGQWAGSDEGCEYVKTWIKPNGVYLYAKEVNCGWGAVTALRGKFWDSSDLNVPLLPKDGHLAFVRVQRNVLNLLGYPWECPDKWVSFGVWFWIKAPEFEVTTLPIEGTFEGFELSIFLDQESLLYNPFIGSIFQQPRSDGGKNWIQIAWVYDRIGVDGVVKSYEISLEPLINWIEANTTADLNESNIVRMDLLAEAHKGEISCTFKSFHYLKKKV